MRTTIYNQYNTRHLINRKTGAPFPKAIRSKLKDIKVEVMTPLHGSPYIWSEIFLPINQAGIETLDNLGAHYYTYNSYSRKQKVLSNIFNMNKVTSLITITNDS